MTNFPGFLARHVRTCEATRDDEEPHPAWMGRVDCPRCARNQSGRIHYEMAPGEKAVFNPSLPPAKLEEE